MIAARRVRSNHALDYAVDEAKQRNVGVVVLEALRLDYPWHSDRFNALIFAGMRSNQQGLAGTGIRYLPLVEPRPDGVLERLAEDASLVVTDDYPSFFLPRLVAAAGRRLRVPLVAVDSNGLLPMRACPQPMAQAVAFRRVLQKSLGPHLARPPRGKQTWRPPPVEVAWQAPELPPGPLCDAHDRLDAFVRGPLAEYDEARHHPDEAAESRLSPALHFGHLGSYEVLHAVAGDHVGGHPVRSGARQGWWGLSPAREAFLDQMVTWRELGFNHCLHHPDTYDKLDVLPAWARQTLARHQHDPRPYRYSLEQLRAAETHDEVWNAAQTQLVEEGRIHNYLRMLWGKKILEWTGSPQEALDVMIELNNAYALDGRDPNSYTGILWVLGMFDRPWAPERLIFGRVRYMSSAAAKRKLRMEGWLHRFSPESTRAR